MPSRSWQKDSNQDHTEDAESDIDSGIDTGENLTSRGAKNLEFNKSSIPNREKPLPRLEEVLSIPSAGDTSTLKKKRKDKAMNEDRNEPDTSRINSTPAVIRIGEVIPTAGISVPGNGLIYIANESFQGGETVNVHPPDDAPPTERRDFYYANNSTGNNSLTYNGPMDNKGLQILFGRRNRS